MLKSIMMAFFTLLIMISPVLAYESLQELYVQAGPQGEYDKYIELDPATEYLGDLRILNDEAVRLIGNGAIIHGRPFYLSIAVTFGRLDISGCILIDGGYGINYSTLARGEIFNNTITGFNEYGIGTIYQDEDDGVHIWDNIITNCYYGFYCVEHHRPVYLGHNTIWSTSSYRYAEQCVD